MILIALQSSVALADFYQPHHSEDEHIETIISDNSFSEDELQTHQSTLKEINHSCHHFCSVNNITFIELNDLFSKNYILSKQIESDFKNKNYLSVILPKDIRPPIA